MIIVDDSVIRELFPELVREDRYVLKPLIHVSIGRLEAEMRKSEEANTNPESFWNHGLIFPESPNEGTEIKAFAMIPVLPIQTRLKGVPATCLGLFKLVGVAIWRGIYDISLDRSDLLLNDGLYADPLGDAKVLCQMIADSSKEFLSKTPLLELKEEAKRLLLAVDPSVIRKDMKQFYGITDMNTAAMAKTQT